MRTAFGIIAGIIVALAVLTAVDVLANQIYPVPPIDLWDRRAVADVFADRPTGALLLNVLSYFLGALAGSYAARRLSRQGWTVWVPAALLALMALAIVLSYPIQPWAQFACFAAPLLGGMLARHIGKADPEEEPDPSELTNDAVL